MDKLALDLYAILFVGSEGVEKETIAQKLSISVPDLETLAQTLNDTVLKEHSPLMIRSFGDSYELLTRGEFKEIIKDTVPVKKEALSDEARETLAIIAYKQPITKKEIDDMRSCDSEKTLAKLLKHNFIKQVRSKEDQGRPAIYMTTDKFLQTYNLPSLASLPPMKAILGLTTE